MSVQVKNLVVAAVGLLSPVTSKGKLFFVNFFRSTKWQWAFKTTAQLDSWSKNSPDSYNMKM